ncbi:MAG: hypothetical protein KU37_03505 [Sulfuricurvum sp. PC08-66]|nr:MAG: hypothetical protein KU37_03505 [Sulfuricurvum sp. PC08-66]
MQRTFLLSLVAINALVAAEDITAAFKEGKASGQIRSYLMVEDNKEGLADYYGATLGGHLKYETGSLWGIKAGIAFYTTNYIRDNVSTTHVEPTASNKGSRYVAGLVDAGNHDTESITNIGELYLSYTLSKSKATVGRMKLNTPFINPEDGRMIPTLEQGVWLASKDVEGFDFQGGYLNAIWNRSTPEWKSVAESLGYGYPQGNAPTTATTASNFGGNTVSNGIYIGSVTYTPLAGVKLEVWDYYVDNIFNTAYFEGNYNAKFGDIKALFGAQLIAQQEVGNGGNSEDSQANATNAQIAKSYFGKGEKSMTYGAKAGVGYNDTTLTFATTMTTDEGRFLFPREWGKEPLFTFQKRERSDGSGGTTAFLLTLEQDFKAIGVNGLTLSIGYGNYFKQDAKNWKLNKYGIPSYAHANIDIFYKFSGSLQGLVIEYLITRKDAIGNTYESASNTNFVFGKNSITVHNLIMNYTF